MQKRTRSNFVWAGVAAFAALVMVAAAISSQRRENSPRNDVQLPHTVAYKTVAPPPTSTVARNTVAPPPTSTVARNTVAPPPTSTVAATKTVAPPPTSTVARNTVAPPPTSTVARNTVAPPPTSTAAYQMELISGECKGDQDSGTNCEGEVKNLTGGALLVSVEVSWYASEGGQLYDWCDGLVDDQPLVPSATSSWHVSCKYNSGLKWYAFKFYDRGKTTGALLKIKDSR
jgi:hypothetical protein